MPPLDAFACGICLALGFGTIVHVVMALAEETDHRRGSGVTRIVVGALAVLAGASLLLN